MRLLQDRGSDHRRVAQPGGGHCAGDRSWSAQARASTTRPRRPDVPPKSGLTILQALLRGAGEVIE
jgi:hypothetical protein